MIKRYAEINSQDDDGKTALHLACMLGNLSMVRLLMEDSKCLVNIHDNRGETPLHIACSSLNDAIIRFLIQSGKADLYTKNESNKTAKEILS